MTRKATNITWHAGSVTHADRCQLLNQRGCVLWLTGLSGSGKSTLARALEQALLTIGHAAYVLDGDNIRHGLNADLGFSQTDRSENIRRVAHVAALLADAGMITITAFISPDAADRLKAREIIEKTSESESTTTQRFFEVFINTPLDICEARDPKALYAKARAGEIADFTGISAPFEVPEASDLQLDTADATVDESVKQALQFLRREDIISQEHANA